MYYQRSVHKKIIRSLLLTNTWTVAIELDGSFGLLPSPKIATLVSCTARGKRQRGKPHRTAVLFYRLPLTAVALRCSLRFAVS